MIRVANIIEDGRIGGPHLRIVNVAKSLSRENFCTTVVVPRVYSKDLTQRLSVENVPYVLCSLHRLTLDYRHLLAFCFLFIPEVLALISCFRKERFDIIHVSGGSWQWKGVIAGRLAGCRVLWHLNDTKMPRPVQWIFKLLARTCCDGFILAGKQVEKYYLESLGVSKALSFIIQAPVDCKRFDPAVTNPDPKLTSNTCLKIVTVANVNWIKGLETFIAMAAEVSSQAGEVKFYIVGPVYDSQQGYYNKLLAQVEKLGLKNLEFYGPSSDVRSILAASDIYVCSSLAEASPISVWEAMAMEKPVVSTRVGDVPYYIEHGKSGFLCPVDDSKAMADLVVALIKDAPLRKAMGQRARSIALDSFDLQRCVQNHADAYTATVAALPMNEKPI